MYRAGNVDSPFATSFSFCRQGNHDWHNSSNEVNPVKAKAKQKVEREEKVKVGSLPMIDVS